MVDGDVEDGIFSCKNEGDSEPKPKGVGQDVKRPIWYPRRRERKSSTTQRIESEFVGKAGIRKIVSC
jgi:hypothetical protein